MTGTLVEEAFTTKFLTMLVSAQVIFDLLCWMLINENAVSKVHPIAIMRKHSLIIML